LRTGESGSASRGPRNFPFLSFLFPFLFPFPFSSFPFGFTPASTDGKKQGPETFAARGLERSRLRALPLVLGARARENLNKIASPVIEHKAAFRSSGGDPPRRRRGGSMARRRGAVGVAAAEISM
jgi:hypothetical protein